MPFEKLQSGDIVVVNAGDLIPADGIITKGAAMIDERALTGESMPSEKNTDDRVFASTVALAGRIQMQVEKAGQETIASGISEILNRTTGHKTMLESKSERIADQLSLPTIALSALAYPIGGSSSALGVLFSSTGYTMRIIGPLATLNFLNMASQNGILVKDGRVFEQLGQVDAFVFDKTGTLTREQPRINRIYSCNGTCDDRVLTYAAAAEYRQNHPIARAILSAAEEKGLCLPDVEDINYEIGYGIRVKIPGKILRLGSERFMKKENISIPYEIEKVMKTCGNRGSSLIMLAADNEMIGAVELSPEVRPEAKQLISDLRLKKISTYIISGDYEHPTQRLAKELGIDHYHAETLPEQKAEIIEQLQRQGKKVCFIGDGINDTIALKKADVSISLCGAATAAVDCAQVILMNEDLTYLTKLLNITEEFEACQKANLKISIIPGIACIGGIFFLNFGLYTSMMIYYSGLAAGIKNATRKIELKS